MKPNLNLGRNSLRVAHPLHFPLHAHAHRVCCWALTWRAHAPAAMRALHCTGVTTAAGSRALATLASEKFAIMEGRRCGFDDLEA